MKTVLVTLGMFLSLTACSSSDDNDLVLSNKEKATAVLNSIESGDQTAIVYINPENYKQHNLGIADGLAGFGAALQQLPAGSAKVNVVRAFEDGNYVFTHTEYNFFGPKAGFDIFRFEEGKIVEHWDNLTAITKPNPSGRTQFDGATEIKDREKTEANKALVKDFVNTILVQGKMDQLGNYFDGDNYIQHNSGIADGLSGLGKALEELGKMGISMIYNKIHMVMGEGNFVLVVSEGAFGGAHTSYYDLFRVENGKIAEHWDVLETILPEAQWKNTNGKF
jgi:predicted SnoaL-like aldol condensation-catalyzing enzyme